MLVSLPSSCHSPYFLLYNVLMRKGIFIVLLFATTGFVFYMLDPARNYLVPKCPFKLLTGLSCPGCGFQRALHAFLHGNLKEAFSYNWFLIASLPYALALVVTNYFLPTSLKNTCHKILENRYVIYSYIIMFFIWWIIRNLFGV